jgi:penicillin-binding protein 2
MYSPGSTFKTVEAPIGLQEGVVTPETRFSCGGVNSSPIKCSHNHFSPLNLIEAIEQSCNPYYWNVFRKIIDNPKYANTREAYIKWKSYVNSFNLGRTFDSDLNVQRSGNVPEPEYYDKYFGKNQWRTMTIRSLSIGQGELLVTPLQLANVAVIVANRGFYYDPHLVRSVSRNKQAEVKKYNKKFTLIDPKNFDPVIEGMYRAYNASHGTARNYKMDTIVMCGKTGTVQNPHGKNHSLFIAFAPRDNPKIVIAVVVENAGFGSTYATPIATLMIAKYLLREFEQPPYEEKMINANLINSN